MEHSATASDTEFKNISEKTTFNELFQYQKLTDENDPESLDRACRINSILFKKIFRSKSSATPLDPQQHEKLKALFTQLSDLIKSYIERNDDLRSEYTKILAFYKERRELVEASVGAPSALKLRKERDTAIGLAKVLLATLQSSRLESEENFRKVAFSSDLIFHTLYKIEDNLDKIQKN